MILRPRSSRVLVAAVVPVAALFLSLSAGCQGDLGKQFREAAGSNLEAGVQQVATGLIDGVFAIYEPQDEADTDTPAE